jgi:WD40 repeat protein
VDQRLSGDGRRALAGFVRLPEKPGATPSAGWRLFDLRGGQQLGELVFPTAILMTAALSPDGTFMALAEPGRQEVQLRDLPGGTPRATLPALQSMAPPVAALNYDPLVFSPDGRYLAAVRGDGKKSDIFLWDLRDPTASRHLARVDAPVGSLSFRGDGRVLAYPAGGNKIALADVTARGEPKVIELPLPLVPQASGGIAGWMTRGQRLAWASASSLLAAPCVNAAGKAAIVFWDTDRQAEQGRWDGDFDVVTLRMAFSPDGKRLAGGDKEGTIHIYDIAARGEVLRLAAIHSVGGFGMLGWPADDRLLSTDLGGNSFTTWEPSGTSLSSVLALGTEGVIDLAFRPEGRSLAVLRGGPQPEVVLVECASGQVRHKLAIPADLKPGALLFRSDGQRLALLGKGQAVVWDLPDWREKTYSLAARADWRQAFHRPAFLAADRLLVVEQMNKDKQVRLSIRDVVSGQEVGAGFITTLYQNPNFGSGANLLWADIQTILSADGRLLLGCSGSLGVSHNPISIWDVASGNRLGELSSGGMGPPPLTPRASDLSPDGKWLCNFHIPSNDVLSVDMTQARLRVWDVSNRRLHWDMRFSGSPSAMMFSPDSRLLAVAYAEGFVELYDVQQKEELFQWQPLRAGAISHLAFSSDGAFLACSSEKQGAVQLLRLGELRRRLADMGLDW